MSEDDFMDRLRRYDSFLNAQIGLTKIKREEVRDPVARNAALDQLMAYNSARGHLYGLFPELKPETEGEERSQ